MSRVELRVCTFINCERNGAIGVFTKLTELAKDTKISVKESRRCFGRCLYGPNVDGFQGPDRVLLCCGVSDQPEGENPTPEEVMDRAQALAQSSRQKAKFWPFFPK